MFGFKKPRFPDENTALADAMINNSQSISGKVKKSRTAEFIENDDEGITRRMLDMGMGSPVPTELRR
jgi:hypothetical protein